jgi:hypothetical protein
MMKASSLAPNKDWFVLTADISASYTMFSTLPSMVVTENAQGISQKNTGSSTCRPSSISASRTSLAHLKKIQAPLHVGRALFQPPEHHWQIIGVACHVHKLVEHVCSYITKLKPEK